jgi:hypothetical protein
VVDLDVVAAACRPVVAWYDWFLTERRARLKPAELARLDEALERLRDIGALPGRLGRARELVLAGGRGAATEDLVRALGVLHIAADHGAGVGTDSTSLQPPLPGVC